METVSQEVGVLIGYRLAGGTIDDNCVQQVILLHQTKQVAEVERFLPPGQFVALALQ